MGIIAVFGPTKRRNKPEVPKPILDCSRDAGARIAAAGHIVLTGGDGSGDDSVKDVAIQGADVAIQRAKGGHWIGVLPRDDGKDGQGWVIRSRLEEKRNFLEALMCDAAIAFFSGGRGTPSEVACAFALQRPVALVDEEKWRATYDLDLDGEGGLLAAKKLLEDAQSFFDDADKRRKHEDKPTVAIAPAFERRMRTCLDPSNAPRLLDAAQSPEPEKRLYRYFDMPADGNMSAVVAWVETASDL